MTTYYVRKTGSDSNAGTSAGAAFLTIGKALTVMVAGDITYVGAGIYREHSLTPTNAGTSGNPITLKGDLDGYQTGDSGIVRITASADDTSFSNANVFNISKDYFTLDSLWLDFASGVTVEMNSQNYNIIQNCWITRGKNTAVHSQGHDCQAINCRLWDFQSCAVAVQMIGGNTTVDSCFIDNIRGSGSTTGINVATGNSSYPTMTVKNCIVRAIKADGGAPDCGIQVNFNSTASCTANIYNNTVQRVWAGGANFSYGIYFQKIANSDTINIYNNDISDIASDAMGTNTIYAVAVDGTQALGSATETSGAVTSLTISNGGNGYKVAPTITFSGGGGSGASATAVITNGVVTGYTNLVGGSGYTSNPSITFQTPAQAGIGATMNGNNNLWSDARDGVYGYVAGASDKQNNATNILVPPLPQGKGFPLGFYLDTSSGGLDAGTTNSGAAPTVDIMSNPRPGSFGQDIGAIEKQGNIVKDSSVYNTASPSTRIDGAGYIDFYFPVNSGKKSTIALYLKTNSNYSGTQPSATILSNNLGMSGNASYSGISNAWQQVTIPQTTAASADGVIVVRVQGFSVASGSSFWIDDITQVEA